MELESELDLHMRKPTTIEEAEAMLWDLEKQNDTPDVAQEQLDENEAEMEKIREWLLQQSA